jgi:outer membrane protein assembly factor BamB
MQPEGRRIGGRSLRASITPRLLARMLAIVASATLGPFAYAGDWLQFGFDAAHSGVNPDEAAISGRIGGFRQVYAASLPADVDGSPVYLQNVQSAGITRDLLFMTTVYGATFAVDAANGQQVWMQTTDGPAPVVGASPAIDPGRLFVYGAGVDGKVHKYNIADGSEIVDAYWPEIVTLKPGVEKMSSALVFASAADGHTYLYATTSNFGYDRGDYQGHVTAIDLASGAQRVFNMLCSNIGEHLAMAPASPNCADAQAGIWGRPGVVYDAFTDRIYITTGNGPYAPGGLGRSWGESVLSLPPALTGPGGAALSAPLDSYTPGEYADLNSYDLDLGVESPAILPAPVGSNIRNLGVQIGKDGIARLLDLDNLSGHAAPGYVGGEIGLVSNLDYRGSLNTQPAVWMDPKNGSTWLLAAYQSAVYGLLVQANARGKPELINAWSLAVGGTSPVVADGVMFFVAQTNDLRALDARTGALLWSAPVTGVHWASPIVVNGTVFLTDNGATLRAFAAPQAAAGIQSQSAAMPGARPARPVYRLRESPNQDRSHAN